ncbi:hypothetical protein LJ656_13430 [Paraburkholderia sp. MMS20-SJTR3]|uniref:PsiF repeat-containing protein n=1 Tax=Paraburkholderia sejongensis TaxID=2886946 RepID=A0ABS8JUK8_9BURK|nr:hypothetical protein [Paraburkholderia sp. MMS20-SJTR3]MCC8393590.1 hypothetical protein [Paraburkholderia sp. MMS20-SJTR3]
MSVRMPLSAFLLAVAMNAAHAADSAVAPASAASSAEQVKRVCRHVWKKDHYEEKCRIVRRGPPPPSRIDQPPPPPGVKKDSPQGNPAKQARDTRAIGPLSAKRPAVD